MLFFLPLRYFYINNNNNIILHNLDNDQDETDRAVSVFNIVLFASAACIPILTFVSSEKVLGIRGTIVLIGIQCLVEAGLGVSHLVVGQYVAMAMAVFNRFMLFVISPLVLCEMYGKHIGPTGFLAVATVVAATVNYSGYFFTYLSIDLLNGNFTVAMLTLNITAGVASFFMSYKLGVWRRRGELKREREGKLSSCI